MFNYVILLNQHPFYIFATDELETISVIKNHRPKVIGVVEGQNLNFKELDVSILLKTQKVSAIEYVEIIDEDYKKNKVDVLLDPDEHQEMLDELESDID